MKFYKITFLAFLFFCSNTFAQVYSDKVVGKKNLNEIDSLKVKKYPYVLPIWGQKATEKGFNLPYSAGLSVNYFWQESELTISNLNVGFNNGPQYNLDNIIRFNSAVSKANSINIRPDVWLFPFLMFMEFLVKPVPLLQLMRVFGFRLISTKIHGQKLRVLPQLPTLT